MPVNEPAGFRSIARAVSKSERAPEVIFPSRFATPRESMRSYFRIAADFG